jgi:hypothetical protein
MVPAMLGRVKLKKPLLVELVNCPLPWLQIMFLVLFLLLVQWKWELRPARTKEVAKQTSDVAKKTSETAKKQAKKSTHKVSLTPKGPKAIFRPFLKFGQAIVKAIFIKNS